MIQKFGHITQEKNKTGQVLKFRTPDGLTFNETSPSGIFDKKGKSILGIDNKLTGSVKAYSYRPEQSDTPNSREVTSMSLQSLPNQQLSYNNRHVYGDTAEPTRLNEASYFDALPFNSSKMPEIKHNLHVFGLNPRKANEEWKNPDQSVSHDEWTRPKSKKIMTGAHMTGHRKALIRSDTFELENPTNEWTPNIDNSPRIQRKRVVKTPVSFQIVFNDEQGSPKSHQPLLPIIKNASKLKSSIFVSGKEVKERKNGDLVWPTGIYVSKLTKSIYVSDSFSHHVNIYNESGNFLKKFGSNGTRDGEFDTPSDLALDSMASKIFVVDSRNHRVQVFDRYCRFLSKIGTGPGRGTGQLNFPWGISVTKSSESA
jgi:hypothetical protein